MHRGTFYVWMRVALWLMLLPGFLATGRAQPVPDASPASVATIDQLEGNWEVEYRDYPKPGEVFRAHLSLFKPRELLRNGQPAKSMAHVAMVDWPSNFAYRRSDESPLSLSGRGEPTFSADGSFEVKHPYFFLGHWGGTSKVRLAGADEIRGKWKYADSGGDEIWRRTRPRITEIEYSSSITEKVPAGETPGRMQTRYSGPSNDMRGNRAGFEVKIYGENLWGYHTVHVEGTDLETRAPYPLYAPDSARTPENVIGLGVSGVFWPKASPGRKWLWVDDQRFPFDLEVLDYPPEPPVLTWLVGENPFSTQVAAEAKVGQVVLVRARVFGPTPTERLDTVLRVVRADGTTESRPIPVYRNQAGFTLESRPLPLTAGPATTPDALRVLGGDRLEVSFKNSVAATLAVLPPELSLRFTQRRPDGSFVDAEQPLVFGTSFHVEARFPAPRTEGLPEVDLSWLPGQSEPIWLHPVPDDPLLYRSREIRLLPTARKLP